MSRSFSIYLDFLRFSAAVLVVLAHVSQDGVVTSSFWLDDFGHEAVVIFFVLSGVVIASTAHRPGETLRTYSVARLSRLYSVVIPALIFSYVVKGAVAIYAGGPLLQEFRSVDLSLQNIFLPPLFLSVSSLWGVDPAWNAPYWSVCYEAWYYIIFGILFFSTSKHKYILAMVAALVAGPAILALFPIWLAGAAFDRSPATKIFGDLRSLAY